MFPVREESPAHYVRDLRLKMEVNSRIPDNFFECLPWFTDVDRMSLSGHGMVPLTEPSSWKLPRSVTSLTIDSPLVTLVQVRDIMLQLPNLNDLALTPDSLAKPDERMLPGNRTALKGRFGGRLLLRGGCVGEDVVNMLLEIPSGLRFTELDIYCTQDPLPSSAVRLAEACRETLVKLSHMFDYPCMSRPFSGWF